MRGRAVAAAVLLMTVTMMSSTMTAPLGASAGATPDGTSGTSGSTESFPGVKPGSTDAGRFQPVTPTRLVDTRSGSGGRLAAGAVGRYELGGSSAARAVTLNVTAVAPAEPGYLTLYPCDQARPETSNVNYGTQAGATPNQVTVALAADGSVCVFTSAATDVLLDVAGWWRPGNGGMLVGTRPQRVYDSRPGRRPARSRLVVDLSRRVPTSTVAVSLTVTSTQTVAEGFVTVHDCRDPLPVVSNLNPMPGMDRPNLVTVGTTTGELCIWSESETGLIVDYVGAWTTRQGGPNLGADPTPDRVVDTRSTGDPLAAGDVRRLAPTAPEVVLANVTATNTREAGWLAVFPCTDGFTGTSSVNFRRGDSASTAVVVDASRGGICALADQATDVVLDVFGAAS